MPYSRHHTPRYRLHRASGQAIVTIAGRDHYLGPWKSKASRAEYDRLIGEWLAAGRPASILPTRSDITITELVAAFWQYCKAYYVKDGVPTGAANNVKFSLHYVKQFYGHTFAADFGPLALRSVQHRMAELKLSRNYINHCSDRIRRMFKWAAAQEILPVGIYQALTTVPGLRKGKTAARETKRIGPVADDIVDVTLPHLRPVVADMVRLQRLTGARPAEICILRPCDIDRTESVWAYRPASHKTEDHGRDRVIFIGPKAQAILLPYLLRDAEAYCFSPAESKADHNAQRREARKTPMTPSQARRRMKRYPRRTPRDRYDTASYRRAIERAADRADEEARKQRPDAGDGQRFVPRWSPNRLRHSAGTKIRAQFGLEASQVVLGHSKADVTQIYAERDLAKAAAIMWDVG